MTVTEPADALAGIRALYEKAIAPHREDHGENWDTECATCMAELSLEVHAKSFIGDLLTRLEHVEQRAKELREELALYKPKEPTDIGGTL